MASVMRERDAQERLDELTRTLNDIIVDTADNDDPKTAMGIVVETDIWKAIDRSNVKRVPRLGPPAFQERRMSKVLLMGVMCMLLVSFFYVFDIHISVVE